MAKFSIKKITTRAKEIRRKHPSMAWLSAVKKAGAEYRGKKKKPARKKKSVGSVRKKTRRTKRISGIRQNADRVDRKRVNVTIGSVSHHKAQARIGLKDQISRAAGRRELEIKVNERRKLSRTIAKLKKEYRALC